MVVSDYLHSIKGTETEPIFIKGMSEMMKDEDIAKAFEVPVAGKIVKAMCVLGESESIEAFIQTEHYQNIKDWGIIVMDAEKGYVSLHPGPKHLKWIFAVTAVAVGAGLYLKLRKKHKLALALKGQ